MSQHLTRKEIKRDELANVMERGVEYAESHARTLFIAAGAALALVLLSALFFLYRNHRAGDANAALAQAIKVFQAPIDPAAPKPDDPANPTFADAAARQTRAKALFGKLRDDYGSTEAGDIATVFLGQIALAEGQPDRARELWNGFVDDHGDHLLAGEVRVNLFRLDRSQGKGQEVAQKLQSMLDEAEPPLPQDVILHELGATQEQLGKKQDAVGSYQRILDEFPQSPFAQEARQKIGELDPARAAAGGMGMSGVPGMPGF
jgi:tetratricopeptide (TPR) repeat protein